jgi:dipeptidyl aminopeptidase/acylaminoacyl peptidase
MNKLEAAQTQMLGEGVRHRAVSYAEDPRKMIIYTESATDAGIYVLCDFVTGDISDIAINYEALPEEWITQKQSVQYKAADGLEIHGYLTLPPFRDAKNLPLVVLPHGGPRSRDFINFDWQSQCLAAHGYAVLQPNFRGSSGYGADFLAAGNGEWGRKMQTDLSDGVRHLVSKGLIDPRRVAILGASYGGYAALAGATLDQGVYRCAISMIDFERDFTNSSDAARIVYWKTLMGDPKAYDAISPARQAAKAYCPILLIHGSDDTVVPVEQSHRMEKALKSAGRPVTLITYTGQDHWETQGSSRIEMMKEVLRFLSNHNPA